MSAAGSPLEADIIVRYQISSASWQPLYDARLNTGNKDHRAGFDADAARVDFSTHGRSLGRCCGHTFNDAANGGCGGAELYPMTVDFEQPMPPVAYNDNAPHETDGAGDGRGWCAAASNAATAPAAAPAAESHVRETRRSTAKCCG